MERNIIWTPAARHHLFELVVKEFGPYSEWEQVTRPGRGLNEKYQQFLEHFAEVVGAKSWKAVSHQIMWSMPVRHNVTRLYEGGHIRMFILNKAAALEAGFINDSDFPPALLAEWEDGVTPEVELSAEAVNEEAQD